MASTSNGNGGPLASAQAAFASLKHRSSTGKHTLLPASNSSGQSVLIPLVPQRDFRAWTIGRGTVFWRIWPAVLAHTLFASVIVTVSLTTDVYLGIPNVMVTVLGVVIGFVIAYRVSSGYDRYWAGRCAWTDMIRTARTMGRLIWFHVPVRLTPRTQDEVKKGVAQERTVEEMEHVMREKYVALDLIEGFAVAVKHHLRGEMGIYYEDLYPLVRPLHDHRVAHKIKLLSPHAAAAASSAKAKAGSSDQTPSASPAPTTSTLPALTPTADATGGGDQTSMSGSHLLPPTAQINSVIPPVQAYGTIKPAPKTAPRIQRSIATMASSSSISSNYAGGNRDSSTEGRPTLLPANRQEIGEGEGIFGSVERELIPCESVVSGVLGTLWGWLTFAPCRKRNQVHIDVEEDEIDEDQPLLGFAPDSSRRTATVARSSTHVKHRPRVAGGGENLPTVVVRCLSEWALVLEERGTVGGNALGALYGSLLQLEASLAVVEMILTTPLPFVYSAHIRHTVWLYLFLLPFQLVDQFGWHAIPGTTIAAFFYLGFIAAGEEIEQPFGYDDNDLDLDLFINEVIRVDIDDLKRTPCGNIYLPTSPTRAGRARDTGKNGKAKDNKDALVSVDDPTESKKADVDDVFGNIQG